MPAKSRLYQIIPSGDMAPGVATMTVAGHIRSDIVAGELALGSRLKLHALSKRYGVGLMPIRGALQQLQGEGLVELTPNCGARVRAVDAEFVANLFDLRVLIETLLARRAAERITPTEITALKEAGAEFEARAKNSDQAALLAANRAFHAIVNDAARNPQATEILARQQDLTTALWSRYGHSQERTVGAISDHRQIIRALETHDVDLAASLATIHAIKARNDLLACMAEIDKRVIGVARQVR
jgi:DNA-binding GntR family transcriptional regulator